MRAWRIEKHGEADVYKRVEIPSPQPKPTEVLIRVKAVGLNHLDIWVRKGVPGHTFPLPITPGCDIAGTIESFGPSTESILSRDPLIKLGSNVLVNPTLSCGRCEACLSGLDPLCQAFGLFGETQDGGCADLISVPVTNIIALPKNLTSVEAASLPVPFVTAWSMLTRKAQLRAGELILIQAGGSGVSVAAIQIAKLLGATVITTVGSDEKAAKAKALGADHVIQYKKTSFREEVKRIATSTGKKGVEVVLDHIGADTFQDSMKCLAWGGRIVTCGATSGSKIELDLKPLFFKNISILGSTMGSKADLLRIVSLTAAGKLKAVIDSTFPMEQYPEAIAKLEKRNVFGKIVVKV